ncbi:MAG: hypothetical protein VKN33_06490 [Candidatus Sericytochromatia bacterium]|nr:hypothetical protein [Candidatus Sericytochromatia bacterium]
MSKPDTPQIHVRFARFSSWFFAVVLIGCHQELPTSTALSLALNDFADQDPVPVSNPVATSETSPASEKGLASPLPPNDPFAPNLWKDASTQTRFTPQLVYQFDPATPGGSPETNIEMYQTKGELEVREVRFLLEGASFRFDRLSKDLIVGDGRLDVGTPPKLTIPAQVTITDTDKNTYAVAKVEANSLFASVYLADIRIKQQGENLSIISVSNFARGNNRHNQRTTEASARVVQRLYPGYLLLPQTQSMRVRALIYSEPDPAQAEAEGLRVHQQAYTLTAPDVASR